MLKFGRHGRPHPVHLRLEGAFGQGSNSRARAWIVWLGERSRRQPRRVGVGSLTEVLEGQRTRVFRRQPRPELEELSFSVLYRDSEARPRSLDIVCQDASQLELCLTGLRFLTRRPGPATPQPGGLPLLTVPEVDENLLVSQERGGEGPGGGAPSEGASSEGSPRRAGGIPCRASRFSSRGRSRTSSDVHARRCHLRSCWAIRRAYSASNSAWRCAMFSGRLKP